MGRSDVVGEMLSDGSVDTDGTTLVDGFKEVVGAELVDGVPDGLSVNAGISIGEGVGGVGILNGEGVGSREVTFVALEVVAFQSSNSNSS